jgi:hypothetical protein
LAIPHAYLLSGFDWSFLALDYLRSFQINVNFLFVIIKIVYGLGTCRHLLGSHVLAFAVSYSCRACCSGSMSHHRAFRVGRTGSYLLRHLLLAIQLLSAVHVLRRKLHLEIMGAYLTLVVIGSSNPVHRFALSS